MRAWWYDAPVSMILPRTDKADRDPSPDEMIESLRLNVVDELNRPGSKSSRRLLVEVIEICTRVRASGRAEEFAADIVTLLRTTSTGRLTDREIRPLFLEIRQRLGLSPLNQPTATYVLWGALPSAFVIFITALAIAIYHQTFMAMLDAPSEILGLPSDALAYILAGSAAGVLLRVFLAVHGGREFAPPHPTLLAIGGALRPIFGIVVGLAFAVLYANVGAIIAAGIKIFAEIALALAGNDAADLYARLYGVATRVQDIWRTHLMSAPLFFVVTAFFTAWTGLAHQVVQGVALTATRMGRR
jgi:hypothetical protein